MKNDNSVYVSRVRVKDVLKYKLKREPTDRELSEVMRYLRNLLLNNLAEFISDAITWTGVDRERD